MIDWLYKVIAGCSKYNVLDSIFSDCFNFADNSIAEESELSITIITPFRYAEDFWTRTTGRKAIINKTLQSSMLLDTSPVEFSEYDLREGVTVPGQLTPELCEDIGIHIGDGSMGIYGEGYQFQYGGDPLNEIEYYKDIVSRLKSLLYNKEFRTRKLSSGAYGCQFKSKAILTFYSRVLGIPIGVKDNIRIPSTILYSRDKDFICGVVRGIVDTDFGLCFNRNKYPCLVASFKSKNLVRNLKYCFNLLKIKSFDKYNVKFKKKDGRIFIGHRIVLYRPSVIEYFNVVGSHHLKNNIKYLLWKQYGRYLKLDFYDQLNKLNAENRNRAEILSKLDSSAGRAPEVGESHKLDVVSSNLTLGTTLRGESC